MQEFQVFDWASMRARIHAKRVFLCVFIPVVFLCIWGLTFSVAPYYQCSVSLTSEHLYPAEGNRVFMLNRPENYELAYTRQSNSLSPEDYCHIVGSTEFLCKVLTTTVTTRDSSFTGSYYEYLVTQYRYPWHKAAMRFLRGKRHIEPGTPLTALDPFYLRHEAVDAFNLISKHISCETNRRTMLTTIGVEAQDALVAALVAQAAVDELERYLQAYHRAHFDDLCACMDAQISRTFAEYQTALKDGDKSRAEMLKEAYHSFERQNIVLRAQKQQTKMFEVLGNASVPTQKAGPHHLTLAAIFTALLTLIALLCICWNELFGVARQ